MNQNRKAFGEHSHPRNTSITSVLKKKKKLNLNHSKNQIFELHRKLMISILHMSSLKQEKSMTEDKSEERRYLQVKQIKSRNYQQ